MPWTHHKVSEQWLFFCTITWNILHSCGNKVEGMKGNKEWQKKLTVYMEENENTQFTQQSCLHLMSNAWCRISRICGGQLRPAGTTQCQAAAGRCAHTQPRECKHTEASFPPDLQWNQQETAEHVTDRKTRFWQNRSQKDYRTCREVSSLLMRQHGGGGGGTGEGRASLVNTHKIMRLLTVTTLCNRATLQPLGYKGGSAQGCMQQTRACFTTTYKQ